MLLYMPRLRLSLPGNVQSSDRFFNAMDEMIFPQKISNPEAEKRILGANRFQSGHGKVDSAPTALFYDIDEDV
jgi:hypothetical protein